MDKIRKALQKLSAKERKKIKNILLQIEAGDFASLDFKKLKGHNDIFRVRRGNLRIIFRSVNGQVKILAIEKRNDTTYNF